MSGTCNGQDKLTAWGDLTFAHTALGERRTATNTVTGPAIRAGGGTVEVVPEMTRGRVLNEQHVNSCLGDGECPFGPLIPNPVPRGSRIQ